MKFSRLYKCGMDLYFEYFKDEPDGKKAKLAYGVQTLAWVSVDGSDNYVPQALPAVYAGQLFSLKEILSER
jgi:hypothetical protein